MNKPNHRVLLLADARAFHTERLASEFENQGCEVLIASLENGSIEHVRLRRRAPWRPLYYAMAAREIRGLVERFRPTVINAHYACSYGFAAASVSRRTGVPLVLNLWGSDILIASRRSWLHRRRSARALATAAYVLADSEYLMGAARAFATPQAEAIVPWGLERRFIRAEAVERTLGSPLKVIVPRTQARVYDNEFILTTLADLVREGVLRVTFTGFGPLTERFRRLAGDLIGNGIGLYSRLERDQFVPFVADHDVYLSASQSDSSPASLIETMGLGLIPVAADIPGVREWLTPETGFLFSPGDRSGLVKIMRELAGRGKQWTEMRRRNLSRVRESAVFEDNVARMIAIFDEVA